MFLYMPGGNIFGFLWFFMLFLAAITSSLSMLQPAIAFLEEGLNVGRKASVAVLGIIALLGSLFVLYFSEGLVALDTMDFWVGTFLIFVLATVQIIVFGWVFGIDRGLAEANRGAQIRIPSWVGFIMKYVSPLYLLVIFVMWCKENLPQYLDKLSEGGVPLYSLGLIGVVWLLLTLLVAFSEKRFTATELEGAEG
ncbi:MAG: hypothetical protein KDD44_03225 [Bdellovibrionales bacterium]|nr:hypothetical protein [Bdellovibrionales bacterium]